ncbi:MAG: long-chain fatty acid--CoA ligase, partial [Myxococcales bacterium]
MPAVEYNAEIIENRPPSVAVQFLERVAKSPDNEAYRYPVAEGQPWKSLTWKQTGEQVNRIAAGLLALGIQPEERVGIASGTRYEWIAADL